MIENNLRRIEILEEMAQAVYREWFVSFRFPGHEDVPLVDSPLGPIPEGWEVATARRRGRLAYVSEAAEADEPVRRRWRYPNPSARWSSTVRETRDRHAA